MRNDATGLHLFYGVEMVFDFAESTEIRYIIDIQYTSLEEEVYICNFNRNQFFVNGSQVSKMMDVLAEKCVACLYPMQLKISRSTEQLLDVLNFEEIQQRWKTIEPQIRQEYIGETVENYLAQMSNTLATKDEFRNSLKKDLLYHLLFPHFQNNGYGAIEIKLPIIASHNFLVFEGTKETEYILDKKQVKTTFDGIIDINKIYYNHRLQGGGIHMKCWRDEGDNTVVRLIGRSEYSTMMENNSISFNISRLKEREKQYLTVEADE